MSALGGLLLLSFVMLCIIDLTRLLQPYEAYKVSLPSWIYLFSPLLVQLGVFPAAALANMSILYSRVGNKARQATFELKDGRSRLPSWLGTPCRIPIYDWPVSLFCSCLILHDNHSFRKITARLPITCVCERERATQLNGRVIPILCEGCNFLKETLDLVQCSFSLRHWSWIAVGDTRAIACLGSTFSRSI